MGTVKTRNPRAKLEKQIPFSKLHKSIQNKSETVYRVEENLCQLFGGINIQTTKKINIRKNHPVNNYPGKLTRQFSKHKRTNGQCIHWKKNSTS